MVDTTDLKSVDLIGRESSSLSTPNILTFFVDIQKKLNKATEKV